MWWATRSCWSMNRLNCWKNSIKSSETPNVFVQQKQQANSSECQPAMEWRSVSSIARKNQCDVHSRLAKLCKIIRVFGCGWEFTAAQSTESPMLMTKRTLQDRAPKAPI